MPLICSAVRNIIAERNGNRKCIPSGPLSNFKYLAIEHSEYYSFYSCMHKNDIHVHNYNLFINIKHYRDYWKKKFDLHFVNRSLCLFIQVLLCL